MQGNPTTRTGIDSVPRDIFPRTAQDIIIDEAIRAGYAAFGEELGKRIAEDALREIGIQQGLGWQRDRLI